MAVRLASSPCCPHVIGEAREIIADDQRTHRDVRFMSTDPTLHLVELSLWLSWYELMGWWDTSFRRRLFRLLSYLLSYFGPLLLYSLVFFCLS